MLALHPGLQGRFLLKRLPHSPVSCFILGFSLLLNEFVSGTGFRPLTGGFEVMAHFNYVRFENSAVGDNERPDG